MLRPLVIWMAMAALYGAFWYWFHGSGVPLTSEEIATYLQRLEDRGREPERLAAARTFMENDTGGEFYMVNLINLREQPLQVGAVVKGETSETTLGRYSSDHMFYALLRRAGYFVMVGSAAAGNIEAWGLNQEPAWTRAGVVRYRSRRDLMEIATDPRFVDAVKYKLAAIEQTFAFPVDPAVTLFGPKHFAGVLVAALGVLLQFLLPWPPRRTARHRKSSATSQVSS